MASQEQENEDESISPQGEDIRNWGEKVIKEIERQNAEEREKEAEYAWKRHLIKLLEKLVEQQDAILQFEKEAARRREEVIANIRVMIFVILVILILTKVFF